VALADSTADEQLSVTVQDGLAVSARLAMPVNARACYVLAHGAGAGMHHPFLAAAAMELAAAGIATLRFQFPYMERRARRPDPPVLCHTTVRAAVREAGRCAPALPLFAGGRSFGGRMASQAQALEPLPGVRGLAFLGFPLHPAMRPSEERARHLAAVRIPMLFVQGTRDALAERALLEALIARLGPRATLQLIADADHSFHVRGRAMTDAQARGGALRALVRWMDSLL
jgi:uncharacterized protein